MTLTSTDRLQDAARQLITAATPRADFDSLARGEIRLDDALARIQARLAWLGQYGELITLCGPPSEDTRQRDLPLASIAIPKLVEAFEQGLVKDSALPDAPATLTWLLLKAAALRGKSAEIPELEACFERWAKAVVPLPEGHALPPIGAATPYDLLIAWLERWAYEGCEFIVLNALAQTRPASLSGSQHERLETLSRKLPGRVALPERDLPYLPARIRPNASRDSLSEEISADLARRAPMSAYLLRRWEPNERTTESALPTGIHHADLLQTLQAQLATSLEAVAQDIHTATLRTEVGGHLQEGSAWLALRPARAETNGLVGAWVWLNLELRAATESYQEAHWDLYLGVDPAGLSLKTFLDLAEAIRNEHERILPALARDVHEQVRNQVAEATQRLRRAPLSQQPNPGNPRRAPV